MASKKKATPKRAPRASAVVKVSPIAARSRGRGREEGAEFPVPPLTSELPADYPAALSDLKQLIAKAQARAALEAQRQPMLLRADVSEHLRAIAEHGEREVEAAVPVEVADAEPAVRALHREVLAGAPGDVLERAAEVAKDPVRLPVRRGLELLDAIGGHAHLPHRHRAPRPRAEADRR